MRKSKPKKRYLLPDPKFQDTLVTKFVNYLMEQGKKSTAYGIFYDAIEIVEKKTTESGLEVWKRAMNNLMPAVEVKSRRVGGATFQVPVEIRPERKINLSIKWLIDYMLDNSLDFPEGFNYSVHSQNPVGKKNIESLVDNFIKFKKEK